MEKPTYREVAEEDLGPYQSQDEAYECNHCHGYGWLGFSKQEMCQVCHGEGRVLRRQ